jgi:hypothetical protein
MAWKFLAARGDLGKYDVDIALAEQRKLPHIPVVIRRPICLDMFDQRIPALLDDVIDLFSDPRRPAASPGAGCPR